jgi:hypothetical protein
MDALLAELRRDYQMRRDARAAAERIDAAACVPGDVADEVSYLLERARHLLERHAA